MPKIKTYDLIVNPDLETKVVGTKKQSSVGGPPFQTVNVSIEQILSVLPTSFASLAFSLPAYDDDAAAAAAGLTTGKLFQTTGLGSGPLNAAGIVMIKQ